MTNPQPLPHAQYLRCPHCGKVLGKRLPSMVILDRLCKVRQPVKLECLQCGGEFIAAPMLARDRENGDNS